MVELADSGKEVIEKALLELPDIIVNKHKGQLIVDSNKEGGTTFIIKLHQNINKTSDGE